MAKEIKEIKYSERTDYFPKDIYEKYFAEKEKDEKEELEQKETGKNKN